MLAKNTMGHPRDQHRLQRKRKKKSKKERYEMQVKEGKRRVRKETFSSHI